MVRLALLFCVPIGPGCTQKLPSWRVWQGSSSILLSTIYLWAHDCLWPHHWSAAWPWLWVSNCHSWSNSCLVFSLGTLGTGDAGKTKQKIRGGPYILFLSPFETLVSFSRFIFWSGPISKILEPRCELNLSLTPVEFPMCLKVGHVLKYLAFMFDRVSGYFQSDGRWKQII